MSNPDATNATNSNVSGNALLSGGIGGFIIIMVIVLLFNFKDAMNPSTFKLMLWIGIPVVAYSITVILNFFTQYSTCNKLNAGNAFLGGIPSFITALIGVGISSITLCRIPVASVFVPLLIGSTADIVKNKTNTNINSLKNSSKNSKPCCTPQVSLESIESKYPMVSGFSYGFYLLFSMLFGTVIGNNFATIC